MTAARTINCPSCGGSLEVKAAGYSVTVGCRYCGSLLDVADPDVKIIAAYHRALEMIPLPLGARGTIFSVEWEVIGALKRTDFEAIWHEMLLFNPYAGYRWLVCSDEGWQFGLMLADQPLDSGYETVEWRGQTFERDYEPQDTVTEEVVGEFYWRVEVGDRVSACTYSRDYQTLSLETSRDELNWTHLVPIGEDEVLGAFSPPSSEETPQEPGGRKTFGKKGKGKGSRRDAAFDAVRAKYEAEYAEDEALEKERSDLPMMFFIAVVAAISILAIMVGFGVSTGGFQTEAKVSVAGENIPATEKTVTLGHINVTRPYQFVTVKAQGSEFVNRWVDLDYSLVDQKTQRAINAYSTAEYYSGYDSDGSWSEGSRGAKTLFAGVPRGTYDVVVSMTANRWSDSSSYTPSDISNSGYSEDITIYFDVRTGGMSWGNYLLFLVLLFIAPLWMTYRGYRDRL